jgi:hypothetical protein
VDDRVSLAIFDGGRDATSCLPEEKALRRHLAGLASKKRASRILAVKSRLLPGEIEPAESPWTHISTSYSSI